MNNTPTPPLQTSTPADIAAIQAIHDSSDAVPHQRAPTPLGILAKLPIEVRNQIYRDVFVQAKVYLQSQWNGLYSRVSGPVLQVLEVSKALRNEALPQFYHHCQFHFTIRYLLPDPEVEEVNRTLQEEILSMRRVVFIAIMADLYEIDSPESSKRVAVLPIKLFAADGPRHLKVSELFEKTSCQGQQMILNTTGGLEPPYTAWRNTHTATLLDIVGFFRGFQTVKIMNKIYTEYGSRRFKPKQLSQHCSIFCNQLQGRVAATLGPGVRVKEEWKQGCLYFDCKEYHPRSYFEGWQSEDGK